MRKISIVIAGLLFSLGASAIETGVEPMLGFDSNKQGVFVRVASGGCTSRSSFAPLRRINQNVREVTFLRIQEDACLAAFPRGVVLFFEYSELGLKPGDNFRIMNSVTGKFHKEENL